MTYHITKQGFTLQMRSPNHPQSAPPSPAPWTFAERMYGIAHCLIGRDGRVIEKCHQALTVPYTP
jgi:hypothetical protein